MWHAKLIQRHKKKHGTSFYSYHMLMMQYFDPICSPVSAYGRIDCSYKASVLAYLFLFAFCESYFDTVLIPDRDGGVLDSFFRDFLRKVTITCLV